MPNSVDLKIKSSVNVCLHSKLFNDIDSVASYNLFAPNGEMRERIFDLLSNLKASF